MYKYHFSLHNVEVWHLDFGTTEQGLSIVAYTGIEGQTGGEGSNDLVVGPIPTGLRCCGPPPRGCLDRFDLDVDPTRPRNVNRLQGVRPAGYR